MRERALIHVAGPAGAGKTAFIESMLGSEQALTLAARCVRDDSLRRSRETAPKSHPELRRYRAAGAIGAAVFSFPASEIGSEAFYLTNLMKEYSEAVVLEGDKPVVFVDLSVFVARPLPAGESLFVRRLRDRAAEELAKADAMEALLSHPDGVVRFMSQVFGGPIVEMARQNPMRFEEARTTLLAGIEMARKARPSPPTEHWAVADGYQGIEHAQLVVVNIRNENERHGGEQVRDDIVRLRRAEDLFKDVLGPRGNKTPVTAVVANLKEPTDPGGKKTIARVRRVFRTTRHGPRRERNVLFRPGLAGVMTYLS